MLDKVHPRVAQRDAFRLDVLEGLAKPRKTLPSRWLYDDRGSELFEAITQLPEYYPTRTETAILTDDAAEIAAFCGAGATLIEYGAGAGVKTEILLRALARPSVYAPVDISGDFLEISAARIEARFPGLVVRPVVADFTQEFDLPMDLPRSGPRAAFFPGSTIGNLSPDDAVAFLERARLHVRAGGAAVIGIDLKKDVATLLRAYDDEAGVTAEFNLNLLARMNRELSGTFAIDRFAHEARWNAAASAVEMHLVSRDAQSVRVDGAPFAFAAGETIHTEDSRKYSVDAFAALAAKAGWMRGPVWMDGGGLFAVVGLRAA